MIIQWALLIWFSSWSLELHLLLKIIIFVCCQYHWGIIIFSFHFCSNWLSFFFYLAFVNCANHLIWFSANLNSGPDSFVWKSEALVWFWWASPKLKTANYPLWLPRWNKMLGDINLCSLDIYYTTIEPAFYAFHFNWNVISKY